MQLAARFGGECSLEEKKHMNKNMNSSPPQKGFHYITNSSIAIQITQMEIQSWKGKTNKMDIGPIVLPEGPPGSQGHAGGNECDYQ